MILRAKFPYAALLLVLAVFLLAPSSSFADEPLGLTPTVTPTETSTPEPTATFTPTLVPIESSTPGPTATLPPDPTNTSTPTLVPENTAEPGPTNTPAPPPPDNPIVATPTMTPTATLTATLTATPTMAPMPVIPTPYALPPSGANDGLLLWMLPLLVGFLLFLTGLAGLERKES